MVLQNGDGRLTYFVIALTDYNLEPVAGLYARGSHSYVRDSRPSASAPRPASPALTAAVTYLRL